MTLICDNFENERCRYFDLLSGTGEELPTGCDARTGACEPYIDIDGDWLFIDDEDCDMLDLVDDAEDE